MTRTRRQHWLPRAAHLKHFTEKGKLTAYQFSNGNKVNFLNTAKKFTTTPENIAHKRDLYETPALPDNTLERFFAEVEGKYGQVLEKKILQKKLLTKRDKEIVTLYVSILESRTPTQQAHLHSWIAEIEEKGRQLSVAHNAPEAAEKWSREMEVMRQQIFAQWLATTIEVNKWGVLDLCFLELADYVTDAELILGDHPVSLIDYTYSNGPFGLNQWHKTAECVVPLTPRLALFGNNCGITGYREIDYNFAREINRRTLSRADKVILSKGDVPEYEAKQVPRQWPQSLLLKFAKLPKGTTDRLLDKIKKQDMHKPASGVRNPRSSEEPRG